MARFRVLVHEAERKAITRGVLNCSMLFLRCYTWGEECAEKLPEFSVEGF
jgi:hypothetical protein